MLIAPPYLYEYELYNLLPQKDRWIFNKLELSERLGYTCGPIGVPPPPGVYCVRPIINIIGPGFGGFFKIDTIQNKNDRNIKAPIGYFWTEWFEGTENWTHYINDIAHSTTRNPVIDNVLIQGKVEKGGPDLPDMLKGISRYMLVQHMGDDNKIIEVGPRCTTDNARQEFIDDYRTVDSSYDPQDLNFEQHCLNGEYIKLRPVQFGDYNGWTWGDSNTNTESQAVNYIQE